MPKIWLTSDWHLGHDREFIWKARDFNSCQEHDEAIIQRHNSVVAPDDIVYVLGDLTLGDLEYGINCIKRMNGIIHVVRGNHDTDRRWVAYNTDVVNIVEQQNAILLNYRKYHFYMSHYPTLTGNLEKESLHQMTLNLFGHTHQKENFYEDRPYMYHVGVDSHSCYPIDLDTIIDHMNYKVKECLEYVEDVPDDFISPEGAQAAADGVWSAAARIREEKTQVITSPDPATATPQDIRAEIATYRGMWRRTQCDKCVWEKQCAPSWAPPYHCPTGMTYKRDPPDGGYYG